MRYSILFVFAFALTLTLSLTPEALAGTAIFEDQQATLQASKNGEAPKAILVVDAGDLVNLSATTPYDSSKLYIIASPEGPAGGIDWTAYVILAQSKFAAPGDLQTEFLIPAGLEGARFAVQAFAVANGGGEVSASPVTSIRIAPQAMVSLSATSQRGDDTAVNDDGTSELSLQSGDDLILTAETAFPESKLYILASPPLSEAGGLDWRQYVVLLAAAMPEPGAREVMFLAPEGFKGDIVVQAFAVSNDGQVAASQATLVHFNN